MSPSPFQNGRRRRLSRREEALVKRLLLRLIRQRQPLTRAQLSDFTGLPLSTVAFNVNRLLKSGWILESQTGFSRGGRPARQLRVNGEKMYLLGVDIGVADTVLAVADFNAQILFSQRLPTKGSPRSLINKLGERIRQLMNTKYAARHFWQCWGERAKIGGC